MTCVIKREGPNVIVDKLTVPGIVMMAVAQLHQCFAYSVYRVLPFQLRQVQTLMTMNINEYHGHGSLNLFAHDFIQLIYNTNSYYSLVPYFDKPF